jgi:hypothetical protein
MMWHCRFPVGGNYPKKSSFQVSEILYQLSKYISPIRQVGWFILLRYFKHSSWMFSRAVFFNRQLPSTEFPKATVKISNLCETLTQPQTMQSAIPSISATFYYYLLLIYSRFPNHQRSKNKFGFRNDFLSWFQVFLFQLTPKALHAIVFPKCTASPFMEFLRHFQVMF